MTLVLFDIDGTLLRTPFSGNDIMTEVGRAMFGEGFDFDGAEFAGQLDRVLFEHAMQRVIVPDAEAAFAAFIGAYERALGERLATVDGSAMALPGGRETVASLSRRGDVATGVVTGNLEAAAWLKLEAAGFERGWFECGAFGDEHAERPGLVELAMGRHAAGHGAAVAADRVFVVGDTPRDVHSAIAHGCVAVGVTTGGYEAAALWEAGASIVADDLRAACVAMGLIDRGGR